MSDTWTVREATIGDSEAIAQLDRETYHHIHQVDRLPGSLWEGDPRSIWQWWMIANPTGKSWSYVAEDKGRIISHNAFCGIWLNIDAEKTLGTYGWGKMTHPDYMRQGVARHLRNTRRRIITGDRGILGLGIASELGQASSRSWGGANPLASSDILIKILNPHGIVLAKTHSRVLAAISKIPLNIALKLPEILKRTSRAIKPGRIAEINYFDERFENLWSKLKDVIGISLWKDSEYLNWRYINRPNVKYKILAVEDEGDVYGFTVLRCIESEYRIGYIVDLLFLPGKESYTSHLIASAIDHLREDGASVAICPVFKHNPCYRLLKNRGFIHRGQSGMWTISKRVEMSTPDITDAGNWYLMHGDSDLI